MEYGHYRMCLSGLMARERIYNPWGGMSKGGGVGEQVPTGIVAMVDVGDRRKTRFSPGDAQVELIGLPESIRPPFTGKFYFSVGCRCYR